MSSLQAFLPRDRANALAGGTRIAARRRGAVLLSDISGFVGLTSGMAQEFGAREGAERIACQLDAVFEPLIDSVHDFGGSVMAFAGDAISSFFPGDDGSRALAAAFRMHARIAGRPAIERGAKAHKLRIRSAVGSGAVRRFAAGDPDFQIFDLIAGAVVDRVSAAVTHARPGDIVVDSATHQALRAALRASALHVAGAPAFWRVHDFSAEVAVWPAPVPVSAAQEQLLRWLPRALRPVLAGSGPDWVAELRVTGALFLGFDGLELETDPQAPRDLDAFLRAVQELADDFDAWLVQVTPDDKGCFAYIAFGTPVASDDVPQRILACARQLRDLGKRFAPVGALRQGLGYGQAWTGTYGSAGRMACGVQGREVNLAARLMQSARAGQILMSESLARLLPSAHLKSSGRLPIKGEAQACAVFEAIEGSRPRGLSDTTAEAYVGRRRECRKIDQALGNLARGGSSCFLVEGEPGIGKSRLLERARAQAVQAKLRCASAAADRVIQSSPLSIWPALLAQAAGREGDEPARLRQWIECALRDQEGLLDFVGLINTLTPLGLPEHPQLATLSAHGRAERLGEILRALIRAACGEQPLLLLVEDVHWLDQASWQILQGLLGEMPDIALMVLLSRRPRKDLAADPASRVAGLPGVEVIRLDGMPASDLCKIVAIRLGVERLTGAIAGFIGERAEGNPYFGIELAYALCGQGVAAVRGGRLERVAPPGDLAELDLPLQIEGLVQSRIDRLGADQQLILKVASAIGQVFSVEALREVHRRTMSADAMALELLELEKLGMIVADESARTPQFRFRHKITQQVVYSRLTREQKLRLHASVARWFRDQGGADDLVLAYHWRQAGDFRRCVDHLERAGERSIASGALAEARRCFDELLELNAQGRARPAADRLGYWKLRGGYVSYSIGEPVRAHERLCAAIALLGLPLPQERLVRRLAIFNQALVQCLYRLRLRAATRLDRDERRKAGWLSAAFMLLSDLNFFRMAPEENLLAGLIHLNLCERLGPSPERALACVALSVSVQPFGPRPLTRYLRERARREIRDTWPLGIDDPDVHQILAFGRLGEGDLDRAQSHAVRAREIADRLGDTALQVRSSSMNRQIYMMRGDHLASMAHTTRFEVAVARQGVQIDEQRELQVTSHYQRAIDAIFLGDAAEADARLQALSGACDDPAISLQRKLWIWTARAQRALQRGEYRLALNEARQLLLNAPLIRPFGPMLLECYAALSEVLLRAWEERALVLDDGWLLRRSMRMLNRFADVYPVGVPRWELQRGRLAHRRGYQRLARWRLERSLRAARQIGMRHDEGLALLAMAGASPRGSRDRQTCAGEAREIFEMLYARPDVRRAEELL